MPGGGFFHRADLFSTGDGKGKNRKYHGKPVSIYSKVFTDFSSCQLPLISGVACRLEMQLNDPSFYMFTKDADASTKKYKLELVGATLICPIKTLNSGLAIDLEKRLHDSPITYHLERVEVKRISIPASLQSVTSDSLMTSSINPDRVLILPISSKIYDGGYGTNPFECCSEFKKADGSKVHMTKATLSLNGISLEQDPAADPDQFVMAAYKMLYKNLGQLMRPVGCAIELAMFKGGSFFLLWDLTASGRAAETGARHPPKDGALRLEVEFDNVLPYAVDLWVLSIFHSSASIDKNRNVTFNFVG